MRKHRITPEKFLEFKEGPNRKCKNKQELTSEIFDAHFFCAPSYPCRVDVKDHSFAGATSGFKRPGLLNEIGMNSEHVFIGLY